MSNTIKKVAKQHGVSVKEVRRDFKEMIKVGMSSPARVGSMHRPLWARLQWVLRNLQKSTESLS